MNEFSEELVNFIEETVKKAVDEHTAKVIEESVKKAVGKYCVETNTQLELLMAIVNMLMCTLAKRSFPNMEELKILLNDTIDKKLEEIRDRNFGKKIEVQESEKVNEKKS